MLLLYFVGFLGLCLSYALTLSSAQVFLTRFYSNLENYIISVERIMQFMHLPEEPPAVIPDKRPPPSWPSEGRIDLDNLRVSQPVRLLVSARAYQPANSVFLSQQNSTSRAYQPKNQSANGLSDSKL